MLRVWVRTVSAEIISSAAIWRARLPLAMLVRTSSSRGLSVSSRLVLSWALRTSSRSVRRISPSISGGNTECPRATPRMTSSSWSAPWFLDTQASAPARAASTAWATSVSALTTMMCASGQAPRMRPRTSPTAKPSGSTSIRTMSGRSQRMTSGRRGSSVWLQPATHRSAEADSREAIASVTMR